MTKFNWYKALGFGLGIWAVAAVVVGVAFALGIFASVWAQVGIAVIMAVVAYTFAVATRTDNPEHALGYGAVFAAIGVLLDLVISQQLVSGLFGLWTYYLTYAAILFAPSVQVMFSNTTSPRAI